MRYQIRTKVDALHTKSFACQQTPFGVHSVQNPKGDALYAQVPQQTRSILFKSHPFLSYSVFNWNLKVVKENL
jgi:hypothetical protein